MASRNVKAAGNPFFADKTSDDVVDDSDFLKPRSSNYVLGNNRMTKQQEDYTRQRQQLLDERKAIEERTLQSAKTSLSLVYEAEKVGISAAEEMVRQGEKLSNIDSNLDAMNSTMRVTQKHLTSMKSMFGGLKNYFSGKSNDPSAAGGSSQWPASKSDLNIPPPPPRSQYQSKLNDTIDTISNESKKVRPHTAFERQGIVFEDEEQEKQRPEIRSSSPKSRSKEVDQILDKNLEDLGLGLGRLKNLAIGLGSEIEQQDDLLNRIMAKEERAEETMGWQNRQMKQILKK